VWLWLWDKQVLLVSIGYMFHRPRGHAYCAIHTISTHPMGPAHGGDHCNRYNYGIFFSYNLVSFRGFG